MFKILKKSEIKKIFVLALLIRVLIMPFYFHPDIKTYNFQESFLKDGVFNIYTYLDRNKVNLPFKEEFVYFPLTYFFLGSYQILVSPFLGGDFKNWLFDSSQVATQHVGVFKYLFLLKSPYLVFDLLIGLTLAEFFIEFEKKKKILVLWLFNPFSIILIYVFSNVDVIPVFFSLLSLISIKQNKSLLSGVLLGIAAGFKAYPLLFLPFLITQTEGVKNKVLILVGSLGVFSLVILPFLPSSGFKDAALVSGLTTRLIFPGLSIGFGQTLITSIISISILIYFNFLNKLDLKDMWKYYLAILLLVFSFMHYHVQWLLWMMPFLILAISYSKKFALPIVFLIMSAFMIPLLYDDKFMSVGLFSVINPLFSLIPTPFGIFQKLYDAYSVQSVLQSLLAGGSLVLIWYLFKEREI